MCAIGCADLREEQKLLKEQNESLKFDKDQLYVDIANIRTEKFNLEEELKTLQVEKSVRLGREKYVVEFELRHVRPFSFSLDDMLKDELNATKISLPVDKEFYEKVSPGDVLNSDFRVGSFIMGGSWSNWQVSVISKRIDP